MGYHLVLLQLVAILCTARIIDLFLRRVGQPFVVSEMIAGLVLGPVVFGAAFPDLQARLFAPSSLPPLQGLVQIGVVLFMFIVGLELRLPAGAKSLLAGATSVGVLGVAVPFGLGLCVAPVLYDRFAMPNVSYWPFATFIAVSFSITAFPVLARIIKERALAGTPLGQLALAAAAVGDLLAWVLIGTVLVFAGAGSDPGRLGEMALGIGALVLVLFGIVRPLARRLLPASGAVGNGPIALLLVGAFVSGYAARCIHVDEIFGGFLFGLCLPRDDRLLAAFTQRIEYFAVAILMPLFFALAGLGTTAGAFSAGSTGVILLILLTAVTGKIIGGFAGARLAGYPSDIALSVGALMNARGLMELIVIKVGLDAGMIGPELFTMFFVMAIVTTVMTGPLLTLFERRSAPIGLTSAN